MCGIVAAVFRDGNFLPFLIEGLKKLECRGCDSARLAVHSAGGVERVRSVGRIAALEVSSSCVCASVGLSRARWATHGAPSERNAHPHVSGGIAVVHNGIIENREALGPEPSSQGYVFTSETDTETIAHLIKAQLHVEPDPFKAVQKVTRRLVGAYAIAVIEQNQPGKVVFAREGSPQGWHGLQRGIRRIRAATGHAQQYLLGKRRHRRTDRNRDSIYTGRRHSSATPGDCVAAVGRCGKTRPASPLRAEGNYRATGEEGAHLRHLSIMAARVLELEPEIKAWGAIADKNHAPFPGRGRLRPIALEGALKPKEISCIHAEACAAEELKHGPLAHVDKAMPVISVAPNDALLDKLKANLKKVQARGGDLYEFADAESLLSTTVPVRVLRLPVRGRDLSPILHAAQLLAYLTALAKGADVDRRRNRIRLVTVE